MPLPNVRPTVPRTRARCATLKAVVFRVAGLLDAEHLAEIEKMGLRPCFFREGAVLPLGNKFGGRHRGFYGFVIASDCRAFRPRPEPQQD